MNMLKGLNYYFFQLGLDFYHQVKIVNYIRRQVYVYVQCQLQALDLHRFRPVSQKMFISVR